MEVQKQNSPSHLKPIEIKQDVLKQRFSFDIGEHETKNSQKRKQNNPTIARVYCLKAVSRPTVQSLN
jgi:hypothetical protein